MLNISSDDSMLTNNTWWVCGNIKVLQEKEGTRQNAGPRAQRLPTLPVPSPFQRTANAIHQLVWRQVKVENVRHVQQTLGGPTCAQ